MGDERVASGARRGYGTYVGATVVLLVVVVAMFEVAHIHIREIVVI